MGMDRNYWEIDGNCREIDLIQDSHPPQRNIKTKRERERERENAISNELFYFSLISNAELQSYIYKRLVVMSLAHMAQDYQLVNLTYALYIKSCVK